MKSPAATRIQVAILVRVSTVKQESARQAAELEGHAAAKGYALVEVCRETISGRADETQRSGLARILELARSGTIKKVLVHEVSRIARKNSVAHSFVESLEECGVSLYWHAHRIETLLPSGKRNPAAGIMLALLAEMARNEVETLRERVLSGLAEARRKGVRLGRPPGSETPAKVLIKKHADIVKHLRNGQSVRNTAKISAKGISTVQRVKRLLAAK
jgi:DNA invertase Pin-like site-specific DNA recombinase